MITRLSRTQAAILDDWDWWLIYASKKSTNPMRVVEILKMRAGDRRDADLMFAHEDSKVHQVEVHTGVWTWAKRLRMAHKKGEANGSG